MKSALTFLFVAALISILAGCGGTSPQTPSGDPPTLQGNWQFTMTAPSDGSFAGGLRGGFLLRTNSTLMGAGVYAIWHPGLGANFCSSGSAPITGNISGQNVTLTAVAGAQTFTLTGTLSADGSTMMGTYASSAPSDDSHCGTAQSGLQWSAHAVPAMSGDVQGFFHSSMRNQVFPLTGSLIQGTNIGASSATVTGTLTFQGFSCLGSSHQTVNVTGTISGNSVILEMIADSGLNAGQIGLTPVTPTNLPPALGSATFEALASGGDVLHGAAGYSLMPTSGCTGGDVGNICVALNGAKDCTQPISLSPAALQFPAQLVGSDPVSQTITLMNSDPAGSTLKDLTLSLIPISSSFSTPSDFNGLRNFTEVDTCANPSGSAFNLAPQQSCLITVSFSPQQSCPWVPDSARIVGNQFASPSQCPPNLTATVRNPPALGATLVVNSTLSADGDATFSVPISGIGMSALVPSTPELDFGAEAVSELSSPQALSFTNQGAHPVQILPAAITPCAGLVNPLLQPVQSGQLDGLLVVRGGGGQAVDAYPSPSNGHNTVSYYCDIDLTSSLPNFQISSDTCTGRLLGVGESCALNISYAPQPATSTATGLDYFLQLNTQQCNGSSLQPNCEIDSGRFPVELKANPTSPLRMFPAAGLNFGTQAKGTPSTPLTVKLSNDARAPSPATVVLKGNVSNGDYIESDDCPGSLAPGGSCTLSIAFIPQKTGFDSGTLTITYLIPGSNVSGATIQTVYLRGTGQ